MKAKLFLLLFLMLSCLCVMAQDTERYATVTNVKTSLNMREKMNTKSAIVGKIPRDERVQVMSYGGSTEWIQVKYNEIIGYVKSDYLQMEENSNITKSTNEQEKGENSIIEGVLSWRFYILLVLAILTYCVGTLEERNHHTAMLELGFYVVLLIAGVLLVQPSYKLDQELKCWFTNEHWIKHSFNVLMLTFYMFVVLQRYFSTCYKLAFDGLKDPETNNVSQVSISYFIWLIPLFLVSAIIAALTGGIGIVLILVVLGLAIKKIYQNCKILDWKHSVLIAVLGLFSCYVFCLVFYSLISQFVLLIIELLGFVALLRAAPTVAAQTVSEAFKTSPSESASVQNSSSDDDYDIVIEGAGSFGGDVKGKSYYDGTIHGENGKWYVKTNDGKVVEKE